MTTHAQIKHRQHRMLRRVMIGSLIAIAAALILIGSTRLSTADSPQAGTPVTPKATATPGGPELVEMEATFTIGDIGQFAHLPSVSVQRVQPDGTVVILDEGFEGAWPPPGWVAQPNWGASSCRAFAGSKSAWVEGSAGLACGSDYYNNGNGFLIYGPFSLADASQASLSLKLWLNSESGYDYLCHMASVDGASFSGVCISGTSSGQWVEQTLDLAAQAREPTVWIALVWNTDSLRVTTEGAFADEVMVTKTTGGPTATPTPTSTPTRTPAPTSTPPPTRTPLPTPSWWWHTEEVHDSVLSFTHTSLAFDNADHPCISFTAGLFYLKLACWDGTAWRTQSAGANWTKGHSSLAFDRSSRPHIAYYRDYFGDRALKYAFRDASGWHHEIADQGNVGEYSSLSLDSNGYPHISYFDRGNFALKYAYKDASGWHTETVDEAGQLGEYTSLALDGSGYPHVSYYYFNSGDLKYAYKDASGWHIETVDSEGRVGQYTSLALDVQGHPHISYYRTSPSCDLKHAHWNGASWDIQLVHGTAASTCSYSQNNTSLDLDSSGRPHISYYQPRHHALWYAHKDGAIWHTELVASGGVGKGNSLKLNPAGQPRISYIDSTEEALKYAIRLDAPRPSPTPTPTVTPTRTPTPVPPAQAQGYNPALAPAVGGGAVVVWYDNRFGPYADTVFARRFGPDGNAVWPADVRVSAEAAISRERYPSIATDESGHSYVIWDGHELFAQKLDPSGQHVWSRDVEVYALWNDFQPKIGLDSYDNWYAAWGTNWDRCEVWPRGTVGPCSQIYVGTGVHNVSVTDPIYEHAYWPDMAVDPDGNIHLAWQQGPSQGDSDIFGMALFSDKERRWPNPVRINSDTGSAPQARPRVAVNAAADTYFVWADKRNGNWDIYAQKFDVNVGHRLWTDDVRVNSDAAAADQTEPDLVVDADGYIYVVWADERSGIADIYAQKLTPDGTSVWPQDLRINATSRADGRSRPVVTVDSTGALYIAWESRRDNQHDIFMQSCTTDGTRRWVADVPVEGVLTRELYLPLIRREVP